MLLTIAALVFFLVLVVWYIQPSLSVGKRVRQKYGLINNYKNCGSIYLSGIITNINPDSSVTVQWDSVISNPPSIQCNTPIVPINQPEGVKFNGGGAYIWFQVPSDPRTQKYGQPTTVSLSDAKALVVV